MPRRRPSVRGTALRPRRPRRLRSRVTASCGMAKVCPREGVITTSASNDEYIPLDGLFQPVEDRQQNYHGRYGCSDGQYAYRGDDVNYRMRLGRQQVTPCELRPQHGSKGRLRPFQSRFCPCRSWSMLSMYSNESSRKNSISGTIFNWLRMRAPSSLRIIHVLSPRAAST